MIGGKVRMYYKKIKELERQLAGANRVIREKRLWMEEQDKTIDALHGRLD